MSSHQEKKNLNSSLPKKGLFTGLNYDLKRVEGSLHIGITVGSKKMELWTNGILLNVLYFVELLKNSSRNYNITLLNIFDQDYKKSKKPDILKDVNVEYFNRSFIKCDLLILMGAIVEEKFLKIFRDLGRKVIYYKMGNDYIVNIEKIIFQEGATQEFTSELDEIWYVPQQHEQNFGYYSTLYRTVAIKVPFIWHPKFLDIELKELKNQGKYKTYDTKKNKKVLGIFEPNINTVKFCLIPTLIAEESYRTPIGKEKIDHLKITNCINTDTHKNKTFVAMMKCLDLQKDNKLFVEHRYRISWIMNTHVDVAIAHQQCNPLNYIYLDCVYMGYPILHNAYLCKDIGYYYEGSNTIEGGKMLNYILENHDSEHKEYLRRNHNILKKYRADNLKLVEAYDVLIENILKGKENKNKIYDLKTNLWKNKKLKSGLK